MHNRRSILRNVPYSQSCLVVVVPKVKERRMFSLCPREAINVRKNNSLSSKTMANKANLRYTKNTLFVPFEDDFSCALNVLI